MSSVEPTMPAQIGRYRVVRHLGAGGMGIVYGAHDPALDRQVAVKLIRGDELKGDIEQASALLRREARVTAKLAHPNVVAIYDVGAHEDSVYVAMELVDGPSLGRWLTIEARPWREVMAMFFQAGLGLAVAHKGGLIHRDFKPGNVLIGGNRARVVDFGLARGIGAARLGDRLIVPADERIDARTTEEAIGAKPMASTRVIPSTDGTWESPSTTTEGPPVDTSIQPSVNLATAVTQASGEVFAGTPPYMAPELFTGGGADTRTDQFAFCVSLYEGLYGERPFQGQTLAELATRVLKGEVQPPPKGTRVPGWLRTIVLKGLAVHPDERHPSIKSMLASIAFTSRIMWD